MIHVAIACPDWMPPTPDFQPRLLGGVSTNMDAVARGLVREGFRVTAITGVAGPPEATLNGYEVKYGHGLSEVPGLLHAVRPQVVWGVQGGWSTAAVRAAKELGVPSFVYVQHPGIVSDHLSVESAPDGWIWVMSWLASYGRPEWRQAVLHPPVDWIDRERIEVHPPARGDRVTLVNLSVDKGAEVFYALARALPDRRFLGILSWGDQIVRDLPNVGIEFADYAVRNVYARTRVLIMPSTTEMFGSTAVQAQYNSIPVVASDLPPLRSALGSGALFVNGLSWRSTPAWKEAILSLDDPGFYAEMSALARANATRYAATGEIGHVAAMMRSMVGGAS